MDSKDFQILSCYGIVNNFQNQVQQTINVIKKANIKTWILTGDEMETLKALATAIKFKDAGKKFFIFTDRDPYDQ